MIKIKRWHKLILIILLSLSAVISYLFAESSDNYIYDLSITIFTSILLYLSIDNVLERYNNKEEKKKLNIVVGKIKPSIDSVYNYFIGIYAGLNRNPIEKTSPILNNIFHHRDALYDEIIKNLKHDELSPYWSPDKSSVNGSISNFHMVYLTWQEAWLSQYISLYTDLTHIQTHYSVFLSSELLLKLEALINPINTVLLTRQGMAKIGLDKIPLTYKTNETFYDSIRLKDIIISFDDFIQCLQKESGIDFMTVKIENINARKDFPLLGQLLKDVI